MFAIQSKRNRKNLQRLNLNTSYQWEELMVFAPTKDLRFPNVFNIQGVKVPLRHHPVVMQPNGGSKPAKMQKTTTKT
jgi:hypothetical protein